MAQRRMFSKNVTRNDQFLDMSQSAQNLYFHLGLDADDDGFVSPKMVMRMLGSTPDDFTALVGRGFIVPFQSGVVIIRHWRINNELKSDRYKPSTLKERRDVLIDDNNIYQHVEEYDPNRTSEESIKLKSLCEFKPNKTVDTNWIQGVSSLVPQYRVGKYSKEKNSKGELTKICETVDNSENLKSWNKYREDHKEKYGVYPA